MRRVAGHLFTLCSTASLLLCVVVCVLWVRSHFVRDALSFGRAGGNDHMLMSLLGRVHLLSETDGKMRYPGGTYYSADPLGANAIWNAGMSGYPVRPEWHFGFIVQKYQRLHMMMTAQVQFVTSHRLIVVPYWALAILSGMTPVASCVRLFRRHKQRRRPGQCPKCGYDLRASPERCPECGTPAM